jgi:5-methylcytosine-specific restriction endonuclease McrA
MEFRNFDDPLYKKWRGKVFRRDFFSCRMCGSKTSLQAHHIRRWADCIELRFVVGNGITLCKVCHSLVKDREEEYAPMFLGLVGTKPNKQSKNDIIDIRMRLRKWPTQ